MPSGPKGEKRHADAIGAAIMVAKIATGEIEEKKPEAGRECARKDWPAQNRSSPSERQKLQD